MAKKEKQKQAGYKSDVLNAQPITGDILSNVVASPREFKSGSVGFFGNDRVTLKMNGRPVKFMVNIQLVAINSGDWPADRPGQASDAPEDGVDHAE